MFITGNIRLARCGPGRKLPVGVTLFDATLGGAVQKKDKTQHFIPLLLGNTEIRPEQFSPMVLFEPAVQERSIGNIWLRYWQWSRMKRQRGADWLSFRDKCDVTAMHAMHEGLSLQYVVARKLIYVPLYAELVSACTEFQKLVRCIKEKPQPLTLLDFDGPDRKLFGVLPNESLDISIESLKRGINSTISPFGHGYVLAGLLAGIPPVEYAQLTIAEQNKYRHAVRCAKKAGRAWRHPPFVFQASSDPEFLKWLHDNS